MDAALWEAAGPAPPDDARLARVPFDHERRMTSALVQAPDGRRLTVTKGAGPVLLGTAGSGADLAGAVCCRWAGSRSGQPPGARLHRDRRIR